MAVFESPHKYDVMCCSSFTILRMYESTICITHTEQTMDISSFFFKTRLIQLMNVDVLYIILYQLVNPTNTRRTYKLSRSLALSRCSLIWSYMKRITNNKNQRKKKSYFVNTNQQLYEKKVWKKNSKKSMHFKMEYIISEWCFREQWIVSSKQNTLFWEENFVLCSLF